jgi:PKD repeat protein
MSFDASSSSDPNSGAAIGTYAWNFGDGATGSGATLRHTYSSPGTYTVTLTVTDNLGLTASSSQRITVYPLPTASVGFSPPAPLIGTPVSFDGSGSSDPNAGATIGTYTWSFGDGATGSGATSSHAYSSPGSYTVTLTVSDSLGLTASRSRQITVFLPPPTASFVVTTPHPAAEVPVQFNGSSSFDRHASITSYRWSFGDGSSASGVDAAHTYSSAGTYRVILTIVSSSGLSATADDALVVVRGSRITKVAVSGKGGSRLLAITVNGPGILWVGSRRIVALRAETVRVRITPARSQARMPRIAHRLQITVKVTFAPQIGVRTTRRVSVGFAT